MGIKPIIKKGRNDICQTVLGTAWDSRPKRTPIVTNTASFAWQSFRTTAESQVGFHTLQQSIHYFQGASFVIMLILHGQDSFPRSESHGQATPLKGITQDMLQKVVENEMVSGLWCRSFVLNLCTVFSSYTSLPELSEDLLSLRPSLKPADS